MLGFLKNLFARPDNTQLREAIQAGAFLVDVRTPGEFAAGSVAGAINIPLDKLSAGLAQFKGKKQVVVFCQSGNRSAMAKSLLAKNGFDNVINGGSWQNVQQAAK